MKVGFIIVWLLFIVCGCSSFAGNKNVDKQTTNETYAGKDTGGISDSEIDSVPVFATRLIAAYPDFRLKYQDNKIVFPDGGCFVYDDKEDKSFTTMLDSSDIEDMFSVPYERGTASPGYLNDGGRSRNEPLFKRMYGNSAAEVQRNLVKVNWFGQTIRFTKVNGAAGRLEAVASELGKHPELRKYLRNASTFYWRKVRGANRQSAHSYGIAIDINTAYSNYWLWANPHCSETDTIKYENRIPNKIVEVFERHGFIWGGRWYHYDTMHFEYRPELCD